MKCDDCDTAEPKPLKPVDEALAFLLQQVKVVEDTEQVDTSVALNRVLAKPVTSTINVPAWNNSAMDGYAFNHADIAQGQPVRVSQRIPAGYQGSLLQAGTAARIFTGAPIPEGADTVVMQEHCHAFSEGGEDFVTIEKKAKAGANIRLAGEDVAVDEVVLESGTKLQAQHLGMAASVGIAALTVYRKLKVAIFSSGDELVMPGEPLAAGKIYNSNRFSLLGLLQKLNCEVIDLGMVEDTLDATCDALLKASEEADLILASGGVSVGEEDHVKPAVEKLGSLQLWKIAVRPGKPLAYGHVNKVPFIGAPGNPVSLFVTFCVFALPWIKKQQGMTGDLQATLIPCTADFDWHRPDKRREYARARLKTNDLGQLMVEVYPSRSSGVLSSVTWADGLVIIDPGEIIHKGDQVKFIAFNELLS
jgi:molybdopterin molybdotransferase